MSSTMLRAGLGVMVLTGMVGVAMATPIAITNPSFENPALDDGGFTTTAPGWTLSGGAGGTLDPDSFYQDNAYDGENVLWLNGGITASQTLADSVMAGTYTLDVWVSHRNRDIGELGPNPYDIQLLVNGTPVTATSKTLPVTVYTHSQLATATFEFADGDPLIGGTLGIRLTNDATLPAPRQQHYDAVSLTYVPEPATLSLLVLGGLALLRRRR